MGEGGDIVRGSIGQSAALSSIPPCDTGVFHGGLAGRVFPL